MNPYIRQFVNELANLYKNDFFILEMLLKPNTPCPTMSSTPLWEGTDFVCFFVAND